MIKKLFLGILVSLITVTASTPVLASALTTPASAVITASAATGATGTNFSDFGGYNVTLTDNSKEFPYEVPKSVIDGLNITEAPKAN